MSSADLLVLAWFNGLLGACLFFAGVGLSYVMLTRSAQRPVTATAAGGRRHPEGGGDFEEVGPEYDDDDAIGADDPRNDRWGGDHLGREAAPPEFDAAEAVQAARRVLAEETRRLAVDAPPTAWPSLDPPAIEAARVGEREADAIVCGALRHRLFLSPKVRGFATKPTRAGWEVHVCLADAPCTTVTAKRRDLALALALKHVYGLDA